MIELIWALGIVGLAVALGIGLALWNIHRD